MGLIDTLSTSPKGSDKSALTLHFLLITIFLDEPPFRGLDGQKIRRDDPRKGQEKCSRQRDEPEMFSQRNKRDNKPDGHDINRGKDQKLAGFAFHKRDFPRADDVDNERLRAQ